MILTYEDSMPCNTIQLSIQILCQSQAMFAMIFVFDSMSFECMLKDTCVNKEREREREIVEREKMEERERRGESRCCWQIIIVFVSYGKV